jgi:hemerythrin superfamily protein
MKATELLLKQHRDVDQLFEKLEDADDADKKAVREELAQTLIAHSAIEKEIFYPAVKQAMPTLVGEAYVEHGIVEYALSQLLSTRVNDETFTAKLMVLKDIIARHMEGEETEMLPRVEGILGETRDQELGAHMEVRFEAIRAKGYKPLLKQALLETAPRTTTRMTASRSSVKKASAKAAKAAPAAKRAAPAKRRATPTRKGAAARTTSTRGGAAPRKTLQRSTRSAAR